ncbi:hypothetical protein ABZ464_51805, partial [Streptomyces sp. NPDC005820]
MDEGALADDGAVGATVVNSAREAVWACYFNDGTWAPEEITMPEDLQTVPAPGSPEHGDWLHKWGLDRPATTGPRLTWNQTSRWLPNSTTLSRRSR